MHELETAIFDRYFQNTNDHEDRLWSWDICYDAFRTVESEDTLTLHLGFYLASWGMYRGSSGLLQKNYQVHRGAIQILKDPLYSKLWCDETNEVSEKDIPLFKQLECELASYYGGKIFIRGKKKDLRITPTATLLTKIILGTMSCLPAYDQYFIDGLKLKGMKNKSFSAKSVNEIFQLIEYNSDLLKKQQQSIFKKLGKHYPLMKLIDIYFWQLGYENSL